MISRVTCLVFGYGLAAATITGKEPYAFLMAFSAVATVFAMYVEGE